MATNPLASSPSGGAGSTYNDPGTGVTYRFDGRAWSPVSSGSTQGPMSPAIPQQPTTPQAPTNNNNPPPVDRSGTQNVDYYINEFGQRVNMTPTSNDAEMREVDSAYGSAMDYLSRAEQSIRGFQPQVEQSINSTYDLNSQLANTQKAQGERQIATAQTDTQSRLQNAITAARQALQESMMGGRQRFGSASNVTKALGEYGTTKFQQASGQARDSAEQTSRSLAEQTQQLNESYSGAIAQLNQWKQTQMQAAQQEFMSKLQQIDANRNEASQNKSFQKIQLLQDMRSRADAIKNQAWTFQQNLEMQRQAYSQQLGTQIKQFGSTATTAVNEINNMDTAPAIASQKVAVAPVTQTGSISPSPSINRNWWESPLSIY